MKSAQFKAIMMILLIFLGIGWFFVGPDISWPKLDGLKDLFKKEKATTRKKTASSSTKRGKVIDSYKGVSVYYNGGVTNVSGRNTTKEGYNLGLKYQCVEFAKRFYYEAYSHRMPDSYGHAKDFYDRSISHGAFNTARGMRQYQNGGPEKPKANDLVVIGASSGNKFGHLFIITKVRSDAIEFIQQNPGPNNPSRGRFPLRSKNGNWYINANQVVGWLRL